MIWPHTRGMTFAIGLTLVLLIAGSTLPANALFDYTYTPTGDSWVDNVPDKPNYGTQTVLEVLKGSWTRQSYIGFDVPTHNWTGSTLRLHVQRVFDGYHAYPDIQVLARLYEGMLWSEDTLTGNLVLSGATLYGDYVYGWNYTYINANDDAGTYVEVDLGGLFTGGAYTLILSKSTDNQTADGRMQFSSRESDYAPELVLSSADPLPAVGGDDSPEPATWVLIACTVAVGALRRRRG